MFFFFQAMLTLSEDDNTGNSIQLTWTLWRATLAMWAWIFSAVEMCESLSASNRLFLTMKRSFWNRDVCMFKEMRRSPLNLFMLYSICWHSDQLHPLLRKTKACFLRLGTSCAATLVFILHICHHMAEIWCLYCWCVMLMWTSSFSPPVFESEIEIFDWFGFTDRASTDRLSPCIGCFPFQVFCFFHHWFTCQSSSV